MAERMVYLRTSVGCCDGGTVGGLLGVMNGAPVGIFVGSCGIYYEVGSMRRHLRNKGLKSVLRTNANEINSPSLGAMLVTMLADTTIQDSNSKNSSNVTNLR